MHPGSSSSLTPGPSTSRPSTTAITPPTLLSSSTASLQRPITSTNDLLFSLSFYPEISSVIYDYWTGEPQWREKLDAIQTQLRNDVDGMTLEPTYDNKLELFTAIHALATSSPLDHWQDEAVVSAAIEGLIYLFHHRPYAIPWNIRHRITYHVGESIHEGYGCPLIKTKKIDGVRVESQTYQFCGIDDPDPKSAKIWREVYGSLTRATKWMKFPPESEGRRSSVNDKISIRLHIPWHVVCWWHEHNPPHASFEGVGGSVLAGDLELDLKWEGEGVYGMEWMT